MNKKYYESTNLRRTSFREPRLLTTPQLKTTKQKTKQNKKQKQNKTKQNKMLYSDNYQELNENLFIHFP